MHINSEINPYKELGVSYTVAGTLTGIVGLEMAKQQRVGISFAENSFEPDIAVHPLMSSLGRFHYGHSGRMGHDRGRVSMTTWNEGLFRYLTDLMVGFCNFEPHITYNNFQGDYGEKYVKGYMRLGHRQIDCIEKVLPN